MGWSHGFQLRAVKIDAGARSPAHTRMEEEVLLLHQGAVTITWPEGSLTLGPGDTLTVPVGLPRTFSNEGSQGAVVYVVRGGDHPKPAQWRAELQPRGHPS